MLSEGLASFREWPVILYSLFSPLHYYFLMEKSVCLLPFLFSLLPGIHPGFPEPSPSTARWPQHMRMNSGLSPGSGRRQPPPSWSYLGSDVVGCPAESGGRDTVQNPFLTHPKVSQLAMTFCIQKDVVQFQIPIRQGRTTWLMLHLSQYDLSSWRDMHISGKSATEREVFKEALPANNRPQSRALTHMATPDPKMPPIHSNMREEFL